ncbi:AAA family ATPase [Nonomuraea phyllanthi]|nr:AAA family ATPase [Nonomuraea phyllanthi]
MYGERDERPQRHTDDEITVEVNGEEPELDPDRTRTVRFPPPNLSKGTDRPPPEPPVWWQQDPGNEPGRRLGHFATNGSHEEPGMDPSPSVGPPPGPIASLGSLGPLNGFPPPLGPPAWDPPSGPDASQATDWNPQPGTGDPETWNPPAGTGASQTWNPPSGTGESETWSPPPGTGGPEAAGWDAAAGLAGPGAPGAPEVPVFPPPRGAAHPPPAPSLPPPVPADVPVAGTSSDSLRPDRLLRTRRRPPAGGWRKAVFVLSRGLIRPTDSKAERHRQELIERVRQPVAAGHFRVAVMSLKGGVGKTTTTMGLGATLAHQRGDRVIAVDANPDRGTLSEKVRMESPATVRDLLNDRAGIWRYADVRSYTSQAPSRLEVLASDRDPAISEAFNADDYRAVAQILEQFYSISITDCGTGMLHSAMSAILDMADQIVLVSPVTVDGARSASATLDWLQAHGHQSLASSAVVVLSAVKSPRRNAVNVAELKEHFTRRCRAVLGVPFDPHLEQGSEVDLELLRTATRDTYLEVAATIADRFGPGAAS